MAGHPTTCWLGRGTFEIAPSFLLTGGLSPESHQGRSAPCTPGRLDGQRGRNDPGRAPRQEAQHYNERKVLFIQTIEQVFCYHKCLPQEHKMCPSREVTSMNVSGAPEAWSHFGESVFRNSCRALNTLNSESFL